uniref:FIP1[III]-like protein n=1 Tax=Noccaea caerulescens TaxID=107243 RepID=A0A1J3IVD9_NOCCA
MDSTDDDFGELYVDDSVQATGALAGDVGIVKSFEEESECATISDESKGFEGTVVKPESQGEMKKFGDSSPCVDACAVNLSEAKEESEYSDSDDDLNIVLKEEDSKFLPFGCGSNTNNGGYAVASQSCSFEKRRTGNWCTMPSGGIVNERMTMEASANQFSHPWSRTSFDANSHVFEKKPWRNPGTDINDFFNYGFNEKSWKDYCKPLGRAIEVKGGTLERIPSVELRLPRDSDPDVVIQIPVTNDVEKLSSITPAAARSLSITSNEATRSSEDDGEDLNSSGDSMKEEAYVGCQDENIASEQCSPKENSCSREVTPCDKEIIEEEKEETCWSSDNLVLSSVERESSLGNDLAYSETESSKGGSIDDQREVSTPPRRTRSVEHEVNTSGERSGTKHSRHRRSHEDPRERHRRIIARYGSPSPDPDLDEKVSSGHGSLYRDSSRNWQNEGRGLPHSNREKRHGRSYSSVDIDRDREHRFGWRNNKETSHDIDRGFDHYNGYKYESRLREYTSRPSFELDQRNSRLRFKEEEDRYGRQHCERKYGRDSRERSPDLAYESNKERTRYDWLREPYYRDRIPITDMDFRFQSEYSSAHGRHNPRENDLHCRRRDDYDYNVHRHRYEDGVDRPESGIPYELSYREMHSFSDVRRREFQGYEIEKRHHYSPDWHLDRFVTEKDGYKYRTQDAWPSSSLSLRDSWYSWRDNARDFATTEAYDSQNSHLYKDAPRNGWTRNNVSMQDRLTYDDDLVRQDRKRYQLADDIQCSMREVTHSEHPSYTDERLRHGIRMSAHDRISTKQRSRYSKSHVQEIDERRHSSKKLRRDGNATINCQDPVGFTGRQGKVSSKSKRRISGDKDTIEQQGHQKPRKGICSSNGKGVQIRDLIDKEEGEIIEEEEEAMNVKGIEVDEERIQESMKKMEKRRKRFKETEFAGTVVVGTLESQTESTAKNCDTTNQQRPVRKRRWCAS